MPIRDLFTLIEFKDIVSAFITIVFAGSVFIQIIPIKINPWDKILKWAGDRINHSVNQKIDTLEKKLDDHIATDTARRIDDVRNNILIFANECSRGIVHSKEQFRFIVSKCDAYEQYIEDNHLKNGVIAEATKLIRDTYQNRLKNDDFLK
ncbi:MAG: hypothetical protein HXO08_09275 [Prevotella salivae]|nr:hypothetical protein [Segatella salivae]DAK40326.1 MAG TPA: hypothetical protein [Caudoviricetes sp.]DAR73994.1 MAG TPA: hypothetical protein [Caudoviricetes sp.]